jgi:protein O-GlcNAc transferase
MPTDDRILLQQGIALHRAGNLDRAAHVYRQLITTNPDNFHALHYLGIIEAGAGNLPKAKALLARSLSIQPPNIEFMENYASILFQSGDHDSALQIAQRGLKFNKNNVSLLYVCAISLYKLKRLDEAIGYFDKVLALQPNHIAAINERGSVLAEMKNYDAALASFKKALALQPNYAEAHLNLGNLYCRTDSYQEAVSAYETAVALKPDLADAWLGRGGALSALHQYDQALASYDKAISLSPASPAAWSGRGNVYFELKRYDEAAAAYDYVLSAHPESAEAWLGRGNVSNELARYDAAFSAYAEAIKLDPGLAEAWLGYGSLLGRRQEPAKAFAALNKAFELRPRIKLLEGQRLHAKLQLCDWTDLDEQVSHLLAALREEKPASDPFSILSLPSSSADQLRCAKHYASQWPRFPALSAGARYAHHRIRIAYLSAQFHEHATSFLLPGLIEHHDRSRFEVTGVSFGPELDSALRRRLKNAFEHFIDVQTKPDEEIAALVRDAEIDIAVDLVGYTQDARPGIFVRRPAPIQVSYLGYLATMATECIDYVIGDKLALPLEQERYYTEKIVHLPDCFMVNDDRLSIAPQTPSRREVGLPDEGFVFCSFNNSYKLSKSTFEVWMRLLARVEGAVLWLVESNAQMAINLRREAHRCAVDPERIVFAPRVPLSEHLARQRLADLFLDTTPYNAGATGAAALWAGVPLLTILGDAFVGRMAASMLHAIGLPELATNSSAEYEALALQIATEPAFCASLKDKLRNNRETCPLFDTERFKRNIEAAYTMMWRLHERGEPPHHLVVNSAGAKT